MMASTTTTATNRNRPETGVVNHGYYEGLEELTPALLSSLKISIVVESDDDETED